MQISGFSINGLETRLPIIQGGMGVGVSLSGLAGAVASQGGIGVISAAQPGFASPDFATNRVAANLEALANHIQIAKSKANRGLVGVNIMYALKNYNDYVQTSIDSGADLIISGAGLPVNLPDLTAGSSIKIAPIVSSVKAVKVLLKLWDKKYNQTADMVVIEGPKAGGHLGFALEDLQKGINFDEEVPGIVACVKEYADKYNKEIPVVFAGGVYTREDIDYYRGLGCAGVQMASRFVATEECDAHPAFKQAYVNARQEDIVLVKSPVGMPGRGINTPLMQIIGAGGKKPVTQCQQCLIECNPAEIPYCITEALVNSVEGNLEEGLFFCGENTWRIDRISTVKEILDELFPDL